MLLCSFCNITSRPVGEALQNARWNWKDHNSNTPSLRYYCPIPVQGSQISIGVAIEFLVQIMIFSALHPYCLVQEELLYHHDDLSNFVFMVAG